MEEDKTRNLLAFLREEVRYFREKSAGLTYEEFASNKDIKKMLNATLNDVVLAVVDLAGEVLKKERRRVPSTYKDIVLASRDIIGDISLRAAPLAKLRNETIHEYMNVNWKNIQYLRSEGIGIVEVFISAVDSYLKKQERNKPE